MPGRPSTKRPSSPSPSAPRSTTRTTRASWLVCWYPRSIGTISRRTWLCGPDKHVMWERNSQGTELVGTALFRLPSLAGTRGNIGVRLPPQPYRVKNPRHQRHLKKKTVSVSGGGAVSCQRVGGGADVNELGCDVRGRQRVTFPRTPSHGYTHHVLAAEETRARLCQGRTLNDNPYDYRKGQANTQWNKMGWGANVKDLDGQATMKPKSGF